MLGNVSNSNKSKFSNKDLPESKVNLIKNLEEYCNQLKAQLTKLEEVLNTETVNSQVVNSQDLYSNTLSSESGEVNHLTSKRILTEYIEALEGQINSLTTVELNSETLTGQLLTIQNTFKAIQLEASTLNAKSLDATILKANSIITEALKLQTLETEDFGSNTAFIDYGTIKDLHSDVADIKEQTSERIETEELEVDSLKSKSIETVNLRVGEGTSEIWRTGILDSATLIGFNKLNIDPEVLIENGYYLLTITKGFTDFVVKVPGELSINITSAWVEDAQSSINGANLVLIHQKELGKVVSISDDNKNIYIQIDVDSSNDLFYRQTGDSKITLTPNGEYRPVYEPYRPVRGAEAIMLGYASGGVSSYRMSVLGEFKAAVKINEGTEELQDVAILNNLFVKDFYNDTTEAWEYTHGKKDQYLSRFQDDVREMAWRDGANVDEDGTLVLTPDYTEEVTDYTGQVIGTRQVPGNEGALLSAKALQNWSGKVGTNIEVWLDGGSISTPTLKLQADCERLRKLGVINGNWNDDEREWEDGKFLKPVIIVTNGGEYRFPAGVDFTVNRSAVMSIYNIPGEEDVVILWGISNVKYFAGYENVNPLTKLGTVTEGEWEAGHLHTKELGIRNPIKWSNDEELDQKDYQVWLNGEEPTEEDLEWVRV